MSILRRSSSIAAFLTVPLVLLRSVSVWLYIVQHRLHLRISLCSAFTTRTVLHPHTTLTA
jgi:hypothetical protein